MDHEQLIDLTSDVADGDEIIVDNDKVPLLKQYSEWIQDSQHVKLVYGKVVNDESGIQRWILFEGESEHKKKAKDYVRALCSATSEVKMKYPCELHALLTNPIIRSHLEEHSGAVLNFTKKPGEVLILGLDPLPVTLAMSALEDVINKHMDVNLEGTDPRKSEASARLDKELRRLSSEEGQHLLNDDYSGTNDAVKRTILSWMREEPYEGLGTEKKELGVAVQQLEQIQLGHVSQEVAACSSGDEGETTSDKPVSPGWPLDTMELHTFAKGMGYSDEEIETVFKRHGKNLSANEFINKLVTSFRKDATKSTTSVEPELCPKQLKHLDGYLQERMDHHREETGNTDIEVLKRNNKKRQETLKQALAERDNEKQEDMRTSDDVIYVDESPMTHKRHQNFNSPQQRHIKKNRSKSTHPESSKDATPAVGEASNTLSSSGHHAGGPSHSGTDHSRNTSDVVRHAQVKSSYTDPMSSSGGATVYKVGVAKEEGPKPQGTVESLQEGGASSLDAVDTVHGGRATRQLQGGAMTLEGGVRQIQGGAMTLEGGVRQLQGGAMTLEGGVRQLPGGAMTLEGGARQIPGGAMTLEGGVRQLQGGATSVEGGSWQQVGGAAQHEGGARPREGNVSSRLKYIVIDGSNIAMSHGNGRIYSCKGIQICVDYFKKRGHTDITVFVPQWRTRAPNPSNPISHQNLLEQLKQQGHLVFTPARRVPGKNIVCYDDKFIIRLAHETGGIMVSNDNYRDLWLEKPEWREIIEKRLTGYSFVGDIFMLPDDPLGRNGPTLDQFLTKEAFWPRADLTTQPGNRAMPYTRPSNPPLCPQPPPNWPPQPTAGWQQVPHSRHKAPQRPNPHTSQQQESSNPKHRSQSQTQELYKQLEKIFEGNERRVLDVLDKNRTVHDVNMLSSLILDGM